jgi:adenine phosphoribosyltransferase
MDALKKVIREVPDYPKKGILFYDITTLVKDPKAFAQALDAMCQRYIGQEIDAVVGVESRGFIFGAAMAYRMGTGFIMIRKPGKLPADVISETYALEYGEDTIEMHRDAVGKGQKVLVVDDLLATGGTAAAACKLIEKAGGEVAECCFMIELNFLDGRKKLDGQKVFSLLQYDA